MKIAIEKARMAKKSKWLKFLFSPYCLICFFCFLLAIDPNKSAALSGVHFMMCDAIFNFEICATKCESQCSLTHPK